jgi:glycosyltransferase involved in cell wall biosynthesis
MTRPLLSVLIDTYNQERYIEQAVASALDQDFPPSEYEILVVDDGSTDRTPEIVRKFAPRVRLLRKKNGGQASAFNIGIPEAQGEIIAFLDGDDWFAPGKLSVVTEALGRNPGAAAAGHGYYEVGEDTQKFEMHVAPQTKLLHLGNAQEAREARLAAPFLHNAALTVRRETLKRVIPIPEILTFCADFPIAMASMARGLLLLDRALYYYRVHTKNLHGGVSPSDPIATRRKCEMGDKMFCVVDAVLRRQGVPAEAISTLIDEPWTITNRECLHRFGGSRLKTFRTEMRAFRWEHKSPSFAYSVFKYVAVGTATFAVSPRRFYELRNWYGRRNISRVRERLVKSGNP